MLTTGELSSRYKIDGWKARLALDSLGNIVQRAGLYRLLPESALKQFEAELHRRGWLKRKGVKAKTA